MVCPICGGNDLTAKMEYSADPYDFSKHKDRTISKGGAHQDLQERYFAEQKMKEGMAEKKGDAPSKVERHCSLCGYTVSDTWKFCPECGVSLLKR
jgi:RNA polymerase subunit RPABC4/transcription elongation factor Spt4